MDEVINNLIELHNEWHRTNNVNDPTSNYEVLDELIQVFDSAMADAEVQDRSKGNNSTEARDAFFLGIVEKMGIDDCYSLIHLVEEPDVYESAKDKIFPLVIQKASESLARKESGSLEKIHKSAGYLGVAFEGPGSANEICSKALSTIEQAFVEGQTDKIVFLINESDKISGFPHPLLTQGLVNGVEKLVKNNSHLSPEEFAVIFSERIDALQDALSIVDEHDLKYTLGSYERNEVSSLPLYHLMYSDAIPDAFHKPMVGILEKNAPGMIHHVAFADNEASGELIPYLKDKQYGGKSIQPPSIYDKEKYSAFAQVVNQSWKIAQHYKTSEFMSATIKNGGGNWEKRAETLSQYSDEQIRSVGDLIDSFNRYVTLPALLEGNHFSELGVLDNRNLNETVSEWVTFDIFANDHSAEQLIALSETYHRNQEQYIGKVRDFDEAGEWHGLFDELDGIKDEKYMAMDGHDKRIYCLTSTEALNQEGKILNHCVGWGGYPSKCQRPENRTNILSIRENINGSWVPTSTVEIKTVILNEYTGEETVHRIDDSEKGFIVIEHSAMENASPSAEDAKLIDAFLNKAKNGTLFDINIDDFGKVDGTGEGVSELKNYLGIEGNEITRERVQQNFEIFANIKDPSTRSGYLVQGAHQDPKTAAHAPYRKSDFSVFFNDKIAHFQKNMTSTHFTNQEIIAQSIEDLFETDDGKPIGDFQKVRESRFTSRDANFFTNDNNPDKMSHLVDSFQKVVMGDYLNFYSYEDAVDAKAALKILGIDADSNTQSFHDLGLSYNAAEIVHNSFGLLSAPSKPKYKTELQIVEDYITTEYKYSQKSKEIHDANKISEFRVVEQELSVEFELNPDGTVKEGSVRGDPKGTLIEGQPPLGSDDNVSHNGPDDVSNKKSPTGTDRESLRIKQGTASVFDKAMGKNAIRIQLIDISNNLRKAEIYRDASMFDLAKQHEAMAKTGAIFMSGLMAGSIGAEYIGFDQKVSDILLDSAEAVAKGDSKIVTLAERISKSKVIANLPAFDMITTPMIYGMAAYNSPDTNMRGTLVTQGAAEVGTLAYSAKYLGRNNPASLAAVELLNYSYYEMNKNSGAMPSLIHTLGAVGGNVTGDILKSTTSLADRATYSDIHIYNTPFDMNIYELNNNGLRSSGSTTASVTPMIIPIMRMRPEGRVENYPRFDNLSGFSQNYVNTFSQDIADELGVNLDIADELGVNLVELGQYIDQRSLVEMGFMKALGESGFAGDKKVAAHVKDELRSYLEQHDRVSIYVEKASNFVEEYNQNAAMYQEMFATQGIDNFDMPFFHLPIDERSIITPQMPDELLQYGKKQYVGRWNRTEADYNDLTYTQQRAIIANALGRDLFVVDPLSVPDALKTNKEEVERLYAQYLDFHLGNEVLKSGAAPIHKAGTNPNYNAQMNALMSAGGVDYLSDPLQELESQVVTLRIENIFEKEHLKLLDQIESINNSLNPWLDRNEKAVVEMEEINNEIARLDREFQEFQDYLRGKDVYSLNGDDEAINIISELQFAQTNLRTKIIEEEERTLKKIDLKEREQSQIDGPNIKNPEYVPEEIKALKEAIKHKKPISDRYMKYTDPKSLEDFIGTDAEKAELEMLIQKYNNMWDEKSHGSILEPRNRHKKLPVIEQNIFEGLSNVVAITSLPKINVTGEAPSPKSNASLANQAIKEGKIINAPNKLTFTNTYADIDLNNYKDAVRKQNPVETMHMAVTLLASTDMSSEQIKTLKAYVNSSLDLYNLKASGAYVKGQLIPEFQKSTVQLINQFDASGFNTEEKDMLNYMVKHASTEIAASQQKYNQLYGKVTDWGKPSSPHSSTKPLPSDQNISESMGELVTDIHSMLNNMSQSLNTHQRDITPSKG